MFGYSDIGVDFLSGSPVPVWLAFVALLGLSLWLYHHTNPPLPFLGRAGLALLRVIAVVALIAALLEPVLSYSRDYVRQRRVSLLVDRSASMSREENGMSRQARLDSILSSDTFSRFRDQIDLRTYYFSDRLEESMAELDGDRTALGEAIAGLARKELGEPADNWLLFSDGRSNSGRDPGEAARGLSAPVSAIYMAENKGSFDVGIADVEVNPVLFAGQPAELKVKLVWHDAKGKSAPVRLLESGAIRSENRFDISQEDGFGEITIKYLPKKPGQKLLTVEIPQLKGEESTGNNQRTIAITVLKSNLSVLIVSGHPDYEVGFLQRFLRESKKYDVDIIMTGRKGGNLSGNFPAKQSELNRYDLVVLHDPDPRTLGGYRKQIQSYLADKGGALWVLMGEQFATAGPVNWFNELLPFAPSGKSRVRYQEFRGVPAEGNLFHPALRLGDDRASIRKAWASLPPFESLVRCDLIAPEGVTLAFAPSFIDNDRKFPILGYRRIGPGKVFASAALPLWSWGFINRGFGEDDRFYRLFIEGTISWLTIPDEFDPIRIRPDKRVFSRGETVRFKGYAFDQGFRPVPGVTGVVTLTDESGSERFEADLIEQGEGEFKAEFSAIPPGRYQFAGMFEKGGVTLKRQTGRVAIEPYSLEELDRSGDPTSMTAVARLSGGGFYTAREFDRALAAIDLSPIVESETREIALWGRFWLLMLFVFALSAEWVLRKFNQLI